MSLFLFLLSSTQRFFTPAHVNTHLHTHEARKAHRAPQSLSLSVFFYAHRASPCKVKISQGCSFGVVSSQHCFLSVFFFLFWHLLFFFFRFFPFLFLFFFCVISFLSLLIYPRSAVFFFFCFATPTRPVLFFFLLCLRRLFKELKTAYASVLHSEHHEPKRTYTLVPFFFFFWLF